MHKTGTPWPVATRVSFIVAFEELRRQYPGLTPLAAPVTPRRSPTPPSPAGVQRAAPPRWPATVRRNRGRHGHHFPHRDGPIRTAGVKPRVIAAHAARRLITAAEKVCLPQQDEPAVRRPLRVRVPKSRLPKLAQASAIDVHHIEFTGSACRLLLVGQE